MVINHICGDNCLSARTAEKFTISCFVCDKKFNSKCFELSAHQKLLSSPSNAFFMCYKCIERVTKLKSNHRRSNETSTATISMRNNDTVNANASNATAVCDNGADKSMISEMLMILNKVNENINHLKSSNDEIKHRIVNLSLDDKNDNINLSAINQNIINLHAKVDHGMKIQTEFGTQNSSLVIGKLNELLNNVHVPSPVNTRTTNSISTTTHGALNKHTNKLTPTIDPLNWSFSFNQSVLPNEHSDLYQLLHSFEQNTWTSFDYLGKKMNEHTDAILLVESVCKDLHAKNTNHHLRSPVTDTIALDNLQQINEKCDNIEKNLLVINSTVQSLHTTSDIEEDSTQQLRNRFMKLINTDVVTNTDEYTIDTNSTSNTAASMNDLSQYQVIDELLRLNKPSTTDISNNNNLRTDDYIQPKVQTIVSNQNQNMKSLHLLGGNVNVNASSNTFNKQFHVSPFDIRIKPNNILDYIADNAKIDRKRIKIRRLTKKGQDVSELSHVNFKIETDEEISSAILQLNFWPSHITIKPWIVKEVLTTTESFLFNKMT